MRVKSNVKAGDTSIDEGDGVKLNHNQTVRGLCVKSRVKAGEGNGDSTKLNHNQTVTR